MDCAAPEDPDRLGCEDLAAVALCTQSGRLYHWLTEVVAFLRRDLANAHGNAQSHRLLRSPDFLLHQLLHGDRTRDCGRRAREHGHEPVAEALHLRAVVGGESLPEGREMGPAELIGRQGLQLGDELSRPDHVGEENRDRLAVCHRRCTP